MPIVGEPIPYLVRPLGVDIMPKLRFVRLIRICLGVSSPTFKVIYPPCEVVNVVADHDRCRPGSGKLRGTGVRGCRAELVLQGPLARKTLSSAEITLVQKGISESLKDPASASLVEATEQAWTPRMS